MLLFNTKGAIGHLYIVVGFLSIRKKGKKTKTTWGFTNTQAQQVRVPLTDLYVKC